MIEVFVPIRHMQLSPISEMLHLYLESAVALFAFMVTAITASKLSASVRDGTAEAQARRIEVERLYQLSLSLMVVDTTKELGPQIAVSIKSTFGCIAVAFCDGLTGEIHVEGSEDQRLEHETLRAIASG
jgi:K+-sensing histidine kinase KdpD